MKFENRILQDAMVVVIAIAIINIGMFLEIPFEAGVLALTVGVGVALLGCIDLSVAIKKQKNPSLLGNEKAIVYIWFVIAITVGFVAIVWWVISYPLFLIIQTMEGIYTYPAEALGTMTLVKNSITWFLAFVVLGCLIYGLVSSFRRTDVQVPYG